MSLGMWFASDFLEEIWVDTSVATTFHPLCCTDRLHILLMEQLLYSSMSLLPESYIVSFPTTDTYSTIDLADHVAQFTGVLGSHPESSTDPFPDPGPTHTYVFYIIQYVGWNISRWNVLSPESRESHQLLCLLPCSRWCKCSKLLLCRGYSSMPFTPGSSKNFVRMADPQIFYYRVYLLPSETCISTRCSVWQANFCLSCPISRMLLMWCSVECPYDRSFKLYHQRCNG